MIARAVRQVPLCQYIALAAAIFAARPAAADLYLVRNGKPLATIVVDHAVLAPGAGDSAHKVIAAANDLREYLFKISGARLPVVGDDQTPVGALILVGPSRAAQALKVDIPHGLTSARLEEGYIEVRGGERLLLAGNDAGPYHGTEYAVYNFLYSLGVRWYMPGEFGEYVPKTADISVAQVSRHVKPDFIFRSWWLHTTPEMAAQERLWKLRNGMNPDDIFAPPGDSSARGFVADEKEAKEHPELFAKNADGTVNPFLPNLTNPQSVEIAAQKMIAYFREHPDAYAIGIAPDDGQPRDFTPTTVAQNLNWTGMLGREGDPGEVSISEEWFRFVNSVARKVHEVYPDHIITTNGYANRDLPPEGVEIDKGVGIMFAAIWCDTLHAFDDTKSWQMRRQAQVLQRWSELSHRVWIYGYDYTMLTTALTPVPTTRRLAKDIPMLKRWGIAGFDDETRNVWAECGIPTKYVQARLEWNASQDVGALLGDFYSHWYGAAAASSHAFWDDLEAAIESTPFLGHDDRILPFVYTPELLASLEAHMAVSEHAASGERERLHVQIDRLILDHLKAYCAMSACEDAADFAGAARHAGEMMDFRGKLNAVNTFFCLPDERRYDSGVWYWGILDRKAYFEKLASLLGGKDGKLLTLLPETARFRTDPDDEGRFARWYLPNTPDADWNEIKTTRPFYAQGYQSTDGAPYTGAIWYRFRDTIAAASKGRRVWLFAPVAETEAWVWINGKFIGHREYHESYERPAEIRMDITDALMPGKRNVVAIRVQTSMNRAAAAGGLQGRVLVYEAEAKQSQP